MHAYMCWGIKLRFVTGNVQLSVLNLEGNSLQQQLTREMFAYDDVTMLKYLNLAGNLLDKVPAVVKRSMSGLQHLNIGHNPLQVGGWNKKAFK